VLSELAQVTVSASYRVAGAIGSSPRRYRSSAPVNRYTVGNEIVVALTGPDALDGATRPDGDTDPGWLDSPAARRRQWVWAAVGMLSVHLDLPAPAALDALRVAALSRGQLIDDLAEDLVSRRLPITDLRI
jgi:hypothetical protein